MRIEDSSGRVLLNRTLSAGESVSLNGVAPFKVVLGFAPGVQMQVDGRTFDFASYVNASQTARFSVPAN